MLSLSKKVLAPLNKFVEPLQVGVLQWHRLTNMADSRLNRLSGAIWWNILLKLPIFFDIHKLKHLKKYLYIKITSYTWHLTPDTWHLTPDTWHVTGDVWWRVNIILKFPVHSSNGLGFMMSWRLGGKDGSLNQWINESVTEVVVEQPRLHWVCKIHQPVYFYHMFLICFFFNTSHTKGRFQKKKPLNLWSWS